jgi:hypothetical protein
MFSAEDEYMAFGLSGSENSSQMEGADVTIAYMDDTRGYATDYNITAKAPVRKFIYLSNLNKQEGTEDNVSIF